jgi:hypothetical protein
MLTTSFKTYAISSAGIEDHKLMPKYVCQNKITDVLGMDGLFTLPCKPVMDI